MAPGIHSSQLNIVNGAQEDLRFTISANGVLLSDNNKTIGVRVCVRVYERVSVRVWGGVINYSVVIFLFKATNWDGVVKSSPR